MIRKSSLPAAEDRHACCTRNSACTAAPPASFGDSARQARSHEPPRPGCCASSSEAAPAKAWIRCQRTSPSFGVPASNWEAACHR